MQSTRHDTKHEASELQLGEFAFSFLCTRASMGEEEEEECLNAEDIQHHQYK